MGGRFILILFFALACSNAGAQATAWGFDTNYVKRYNDRLAISVFQSVKSFGLAFTQRVTSDSANTSPVNYIARSNTVTGIGLAYDKVSFSLGIKTPATDADIYKKGVTDYLDYSIAFTSNKYRVEAAYKNYKGFYDANTPRYDTTYADSTPYYQRPGMRNMLMRVKFFYFFNKKRFSYGASYNNTYRQMKAAGSPFAYADIFYNRISDPVSFVPPPLYPAYGEYRNLNKVLARGMTLGVGYSLNLVLLRTLYLNGTLGLAGQFYQQDISSSDGLINRSVFKAGITGADIRGALGYNAKNLFISLMFTTEISVYQYTHANLTSTLFSGAITLGYRFPFKERKWIKWVKDNKYYKML